MMKYVIVNFLVITIVCIYIVENKVEKKKKKDWSHNLKINKKSGPFSQK